MIEIEKSRKRLEISRVDGTEKVRVKISEGSFKIEMQLEPSELAAIRNQCSHELDRIRNLKRLREKHTGQLELNTDR